MNIFLSTSCSCFFSVSILSPLLPCHSVSTCHISSKSDHLRRSYDVLSIFKTRAAASRYYFRFAFSGDVTLFKRQSLSANQISSTHQSTTEIQLLPVLKNKRPPYWNFSGFDFHHIVVIAVSLRLALPHFIYF